MKYKRLYTFGCSYTAFFWPTWAEIIAFDTGLPFENWALCGGGNVGMAHRMVECDIKNTFTEEDLVLPLWSTWHREDRYIHEQWSKYGNIFNDESMYNAKFRKKYWDPDNDIIKNVGTMIMAKRSFPIQYEACITESGGLAYNDRSLFNFYKPYMPTDVFPWTQSDWNFGGALEHVDNHPDIAAHLKYVQEYVYPVIGLEMQSKTIAHFTELQNYITQLGKLGETKKKIKHWGDLEKFFEDHIGHTRPDIGH